MYLSSFLIGAVARVLLPPLLPSFDTSALLWISSRLLDSMFNKNALGERVQEVERRSEDSPQYSRQQTGIAHFHRSRNYLALI